MGAGAAPGCRSTSNAAATGGWGCSGVAAGAAKDAGDNTVHTWQVKKVWALFETDELGRPQKKIAGSKEGWSNEELQRQGYEPSNNMGHEDPKKKQKFNPPILLMVCDWQLSDLIRSRWQHDATHLQNSQQCLWKAMENVSHGNLPKEQQNSSFSILSRKPMVVESEKDQALAMGIHENGERAYIEEDKHVVEGVANRKGSKEQDIVLSTYRLHVENPGDNGLGMSFAAPLILSRTLLEQKLNCCGRDLQNVSFLNLNHEGLSSLGDSVLNHWCPKIRILTADMNRLNSLKNAFAGYEETLEQLSLKDNFLCELNGLECLRNLQVVHLDGNYLLHVCASNLNLLEEFSKEGFRDNVNIDVVGQGRRKVVLPISLGSARCLPLLCWRSLREFGVSCNRISKVERLGLLCPNLEVLDLGSNNLVSLGWSEESALFGLRCLRVLDVGQNRLKGSSLWDNLRHCPLLVSLVASRNRLEDLPTHDGSVFLRELWLNGNSIRCFACAAWLPNLQRLYLQDNEIDTLMPICGFPSLEVLDLSFNKISEVHQLQQLGCFSNLRSLQLNDNPAAELPDYTVKVLEAVPWLVELDNEPLTDFSRLQAVKNLYSNIVSTCGLWYVRSNILKGKLPCPSILKTQSQGKISHERNLILVNSIMAGDAELNTLWAILLEVSHMYISTYFGKAQSCLSPFSKECQWRLQSFWLMCLAQKKRLSNSLRESASLKGGRDSSLGDVSGMMHCHVGNNGMASAEPYTGGGICIKSSYVADLERCLGEHIQFNGSPYENVLILNESYKLELELHDRRVSKVQALARGFLVRKQELAARKQLLSISPRKTHKGNLDFHAAAKIQAYWKGWKARGFLQHLIARKMKSVRSIARFQALWRGFRTRKRFQLAMQDCKYEDSDDFEYPLLVETDYLPKFSQLHELDPCSIYSGFQNKYDIHELPSQLLHYFQEADTPQTNEMQGGKLFSGSHCKGHEAESGKHLHLAVEKKAAVAEITKDWGFSDEKTALQLMRALANTRKRIKEAPRASSQARYNAFISKCAKHSSLFTNPCLPVSQQVKPESIEDELNGCPIADSKGGLPLQARRYITPSQALKLGTWWSCSHG
ncbi:hypothetical protein GOP47_0012798 [Adiantum capillus-veneris]|uniref:Uncharacterized protein n=1 Tax=Adiantum capillus-veneris TaxID=13818 RepID=A0A9D4URW4_ADICA|nr:hypothetical protein GOP47_0012798 [Adiantum capillus-veneris]